jgi:hypothetical protein
VIWNILCPKCGATLDCTTDMLGGLVECGGCAQVFGAPKEALPAPDPRFDRRMTEEEWEEARDDSDDGTPGKRRGLGKATASLVLGILALSVGSVFMMCLPFVQTILGVLAVLFGFFGLKTEGRKIAIAGMVMGALASILSLLAGVMLGTLFWSMNAAKKPAPPPPAFKVAPMTKSTMKW